MKPLLPRLSLPQRRFRILVSLSESMVSLAGDVGQQQDKLARAERLQTAIAALEARLAQLESEGRVAPQGCCVDRYQARGQQKAYSVNQKVFSRRAIAKYFVVYDTF